MKSVWRISIGLIRVIFNFDSKENNVIKLLKIFIKTQHQKLVTLSLFSN